MHVADDAVDAKPAGLGTLPADLLHLRAAVYCVHFKAGLAPQQSNPYGIGASAYVQRALIRPQLDYGHETVEKPAP